MAHPDWVIKHKEPKTEIKCINGMYYKYAVQYQYNKQKKRTDKITGVLLGKITQDKGFMPSAKRMAIQSSKVHTVDVKPYGTYALFDALIKDEIKDLPNFIDPRQAEILLTVAYLRFVNQSAIKRMPFLHAHDFCSQVWATDGITTKSITQTLKTLGENRLSILSWLRKRAANFFDADSNFVLIDSSDVPSASERLIGAVEGYNASMDYEKQIKLMYIFSAEFKMPVYYRLINGNITDVSSMKACVDEFQHKNLIYIADKGFYSKANTDTLDQWQLQYIIPLHRNSTLIDYKPMEQANFKRNIKNYFMYQNRPIWYYSYQSEGHAIHTFLDGKLRESEEMDYLNRIKTHPEKYKEPEFFDRLHSFGTLSLITNVEQNLSSEKIYSIYKERNDIEVAFNAFKNFLHADRTYMQDRCVMEGWMLANFIAMIAYYRLLKALQTKKLNDKYSPKDIITFCERIYKTRQSQSWTTSEVTKKVRDLLNNIGIDYLNAES